ncbi:MAG TPA: Gfo/Idh/MocA family oxidoreductase [Lentibacillus sp.]|uniref:Gfo/Idh/MocA family protein n=1 Tax=Lentibacillus sp. TaxID=1925746 RepID=UPI002B4B4B09|nr:Gfo/Idh/MocA family oxidoreductase [Lentibacillus sp.]HLR62138.1 Gfo/Idh/MocA family oxidoreductase [Lentibacillus sp.]
MEKVKVGCIGAGIIASFHLKNLNKDENAEITAVCDIVQENADRMGKEYGATAYTDAEEMLENEQLDALFLCVPPFAHGDIEEKAVSKGIHMMVEKPLGLEMESVRAKMEVIKNSSVICATGYCLRYLDTVAKAKEYLKDKKIAMMRGYYLTKFVETPWYRDMAKSGGQLVEQSTHIVDMLRYFAGDVEKVSADMNLLVSQDIPNINVPDVTSVNMSFHSGAVGHIDSSFIQNDHRMGAEILGHNFRVTIDGTTLIIHEEDRTITYDSKVDFYEEQDKVFIKAVQTNNRDLILSDYENGAKTLEVTLAANKSSENEMAVRLQKW